MATKKIVLNGPFYLPNDKNRKYPQGIIPKDCQFDSDYLKNTFWKNEEFMNSINATTSGDGVQFILRNHIASIGMSANNIHRCNFDINALEKTSKEEAIRLTLQLANRNLLDRRKKHKEDVSMQCAKKQKVDTENSSLVNKNTNIKCKNKETMSSEAPLLNNVCNDI